MEPRAASTPRRAGSRRFVRWLRIASWTAVGLAAVVWAPAALGEAIPGPPLTAASSGAFCLPQGTGGLGAAGFATAVAAIAVVARRQQRDPA